ncbi:GntR family transcriptional regulator [Tranquillimonas rosea]|uniref:GntR family transcriptional regulator n=1 Tax=Tranquillimonas rosea TaxID=641238 RepID=UPI003BA8EF6C
MESSLRAALDLGRLRAASPRPSASSRVYEDLRQRIISLDFPPGTNLFRTELAKQYEVSQTPIRDAMQRLEQDGLVKIYPQSKTVVTRIDIPQIFEAHFLRTALETEVVRELARQPSGETVERARSILRMQQTIAEDRAQVPLFQELDEFFHQILFEGIGRDSLHRLIRSHSGHLDRVRRLNWPDQDKIDRIVAGHAEILDSISAGDEDAAVAAIREHLSKTVSRVEEFRSENEEYFA